MPKRINLAFIAVFLTNLDAIISGGAPTKEGRNGKCYAGEGNLLNFNGNGEGMWIFSRELVIEKSKLDSLKQKAEELGLDSSQLNDIENAGCLFNRSEQKLIE